jgi:crotonobetainyl-CoA:carnitine CoA-transferase CaiB-like acyl-CoA transferase
MTAVVSNQRRGALTGVKIVDLSRVLGGPYCTQMLGDHGADVIKIEPPSGDETRLWGAAVHNGASAYFTNINRNKRMVAIDLGKSQGREALFLLLKDADVLVHNFKCGTLERWGMSYEDVLSVRFPRLIYCHITGFGETGPLGGLPGYDGAVQALAGNMSVNGSPESGPMRVGMPLVDMTTGLNAAFAIAMALHERNTSGLGQKIDVCLYDCAISMLHPHAPNLLLTGKQPQLTGNAHPNISPYDLYVTANGGLFLAVGNNGQFAKLCEVIGRGALAQKPEYATNVLRVKNRVALKKELEQALGSFEAQSLCETLLRAGVPAGAVLDTAAVLDAPHTAHRQMVVQQGDYRGVGIPIKYDRTPGAVRLTPQALGRHTRSVFEENGLSQADYESLLQSGTLIEDS